MEDNKKMEYYTEENPGGPWLKALKRMVERDILLKDKEFKESFKRT
jgi:hypothetical protein